MNLTKLTTSFGLTSILTATMLLGLTSSALASCSYKGEKFEEGDKIDGLVCRDGIWDVDKES